MANEEFEFKQRVLRSLKEFDNIDGFKRQTLKNIIETIAKSYLTATFCKEEEKEFFRKN